MSDRSIQRQCTRYSTALIEPLPRTAADCKAFALRMMTREKDAIRKWIENVPSAGYPGPCEAKLILADLNRERYQIEAARLEHIRRVNEKLMQVIEENGHKVDCHWDTAMERSANYIKQRHERDIKHAKYLEKIRLSELKKHRQNVDSIESEYSRCKVEKNMKYEVKRIYHEAVWPCSDWWNEYLECVASINPLRRPPPRRLISRRDELDAFEETFRKQIDCSLVPADYKNDRESCIAPTSMRSQDEASQS